ncbi:hypothetical protein N9L06_07610 [Mariniblastus sp.]|nr:hypothetical protein [Mariniblastus sp.]
MLILPYAVQAEDFLRTVVVSGDPVPGIAPLISSGFFVEINNDGATAFRAQLSGQSVNSSNDNAIVLENANAGIELFARESSTAPETEPEENFVFSFNRRVSYGDSGHVAFFSDLRDLSDPDDPDDPDDPNDPNDPNFPEGGGGIFIRDPNGNIELVARDGMLPPSNVSRILSPFEFLRNADLLLSDDGRLAFASPDGDALFRKNINEPLVVLLERGSTLPDDALGELEITLLSSEARDSAGQLAVAASFRGEVGGQPIGGQGIFVENENGTFELIARGGDPVADSGGLSFASVRSGLNRSAEGNVVTLANLFDSSTESSVIGVIQANTDGILDLIAVVGSNTVGTEIVEIREMSDIIQNDQGLTAFRSTVFLDNTELRAIFKAGLDGELLRVVQAGDSLPGIPPTAEASFFGAPVLNNNNQVAFSARFTGDGITSGNDEALFAEDPSGTLQLIAREGDQIDVNDEPFVTDLRTIERLGLQNGGAGDNSGLNDVGQLAFSAFFTDDTNGVFVSNKATLVLLTTGDFDDDEDVDCDDLDSYIGNLGLTVTAELALLDLDNDGIITAADANTHITTLVMTSNGEVGTFPGDFNCDGDVDVLGDAFALVGNLGNSVMSYSQGDANFDGTVDVLGDAFILVGNLGLSNEP